MQNKYGPLYEALDEHVEDIAKSDSYAEWGNVRALYEHFKGKFTE